MVVYINNFEIGHKITQKKWNIQYQLKKMLNFQKKNIFLSDPKTISRMKIWQLDNSIFKECT
jgi:hypothetical protein